MPARRDGVSDRRLAGDPRTREADHLCPSGSAAEWDHIRSIHGDIVTLTDELLGSLRILLTSLTAVRRDI